MWDGGYMHYMWFGSLFMGLIWVLIVAGFFLFWKWARHSNCCESNKDYAMVVLRERYARGEVTKKQFDAIKKDLMK